MMLTEAKFIDRLTARLMYRYVDEMLLERLADTSSAPPPANAHNATAAPKRHRARREAKQPSK